MDINHFLQRIDAAQERLEKLQQTADTTTVTQQITELRLDLSVALEELRVAHEELHQQSEQIYAANEKLQIERERYLELFEFAPGGYIVTDTHGIIREANRAAAALLNAQPRYLVGKPLAVFIAREKMKEFHTNLASGLKRTVQLEWETVLKPRGSTPIDVVITMSAVRPIAGLEATIGWLLRDVTLRNQTEKALQASQHFIQRAAEALPDMLFIFDRVNQRYVYASRGVTRILGYAPQDFVQMSPAMITNLRHPDDLARISEFDTRIETAGDDQIIETTYRMKHIDGNWRWLTSREMVFARNTNGLPYQTVGIAQDVTERIVIDERIRQRNRELTALNLISAAVSSTLELPTLFSLLRSLLVQQLDVQGGAIFLYSHNRQQLDLQTSWGLPDDLLERMKGLPLELLARNQALAEEKNALAQGRCDAILSLLTKTIAPTPNYQSCLSLQFPSDSNAQGVIDLLSYDPFLFNPRWVEFPAACCETVY
jgi:PAS domain S-box-containing protein